MQKDQFAPLPRGKLAAYSAIIASLMIIGVVAAIIGGASFWRVMTATTIACPTATCASLEDMVILPNVEVNRSKEGAAHAPHETYLTQESVPTIG